MMRTWLPCWAAFVWLNSGSMKPPICSDACWRIKSDDAHTLNNLATVLAERPENRPEALRCINLAIEIAGQQSDLLDTKGTILMLDGKPADAVPLLEQAATSLAADPRYHLHLAVAYDRTRQPEKARTALPHCLQESLDPAGTDPDGSKRAGGLAEEVQLR